MNQKVLSFGDNSGFVIGETVIDIVGEADAEISERLKEHRSDLGEDAAGRGRAKRQAKPHIHDALPLEPVIWGKLRDEDGVVASLDVRGSSKAACRGVVGDVAERLIIKTLIAVPQVGVPGVEYQSKFLGYGALVHAQGEDAARWRGVRPPSLSDARRRYKGRDF